jgi:hypothetical protein
VDVRVPVEEARVNWNTGNLAASDKGRRKTRATD